MKVLCPCIWTYLLTGVVLVLSDNHRKKRNFNLDEKINISNVANVVSSFRGNFSSKSVEHLKFNDVTSILARIEDISSRILTTTKAKRHNLISMKNVTTEEPEFQIVFLDMKATV